MNEVKVTRTNIKIEPDAARVLIRPFVPTPYRVEKITARITGQPDEEVDEHLEKTFADFANRHIEVENTFLKRYREMLHLLPDNFSTDRQRQLLIGSYFTSEYSLESAALCNPSIVPHPDQTNLPQGSTRFVMSLRAVGEGHISSVAFRYGIIDGDNQIQLRQPTRFVETPHPVASPTIDDLDDVPDGQSGANYDIQFDPSIPIGGRALFPYSPLEKHGIEDARFVRFGDKDGSCCFYATATAWDGKATWSQLIETNDFLAFKVRGLVGEAVRNKGMALFPRKIDGKYAMISRQDSENIYLMYSDRVHSWNETRLIVEPRYPWEYYQMGNCGSPIETERGWLLITHGVGAMRRYAIGAVLLDLEDPSRVIGRTRTPLLVPNENEREGYVPNVVYSCGSMIHNGTLVLPYAMADYATRVALMDVEELVSSMIPKDGV